MTCPKCGRSNPEDSKFCIYCSSRMAEPEHVSASTGQTVLLDSTTVAPVPPTAQLAPTTSQQGISSGVIGAVWLIGIGLLIMFKLMWPGILILLGLTAFLHDSSSGRSQSGLRTLVFFVGIAFLYWTRLFWPGMLILLGIVALLSPEVRGGRA